LAQRRFAFLDPVTNQVELGLAFKKSLDLFASLAPYRRLLMQEHERTGLAPVRPMWMHFPSVRGAAVMERLQVMLGPLLLFIPITTPGMTKLGDHITEPADPPPDDGPDDDGLHFQTTSDDINTVFDDLDGEKEIAKAIWTYLKKWFSRPPAPGSPRVITNTPQELPPRHHGRPWIPQGTWRHAFLPNVSITVKAVSGVYIHSTHPLANVPCLPGQPFILVREITKDEMEHVIGRALGEDGQYWLDGMKWYDLPMHRIRNAMQKYERFRSSLPFQ
jgi:hypothetical protein